VGGNVEPLKERLTEFLKDLPEMLPNLPGALTAEDATSIEGAVRKFKGSVSSFAAQPAICLASVPGCKLT
jgi:hypothetical protein